LLLYNQIRFDSRFYAEESIVMESRITWLPINTQMQEQVPFKVSTTKLYLQDEYLNLD